ncbi:MAG: DUF2493 domain-containing protein [Candidatus Heimdallarchaeaceae archaeon]
MKKIGIVGTRRRDNPEAYNKVEESFLEIYEEEDWIVSGGCGKGGDRFAQVIAKKFGVPILIFYPDWNKYNTGAGFVRNRDIAIHSDVLIACVAKDRKGGTENTIMNFHKFNKQDVRLIT